MGLALRPQLPPLDDDSVIIIIIIAQHAEQDKVCHGINHSCRKTAQCDTLSAFTDHEVQKVRITDHDWQCAASLWRMPQAHNTCTTVQMGYQLLAMYVLTTGGT